MNYKFLTGARKAGVMLALVLLGVSGAFAAVVNVNLGDIKFANGTARGNPTAATNKVDTASGGLDKFAVWDDQKSTPEMTVSAIFKWRYPNNTVTPAVTAGYEDTLYFVVSTTAAATGKDTVKITGTLPTSVAVSQVNFAGVPGLVQWEGSIKGRNTAAARGVSEFLYYGKTPAKDKAIHLLSGSIESWAKSVLKDIATPTSSDSLTKSGVTSGTRNMVGAIGSASAGSRVLTVAHHGRNAAFVGAENANFAINPPGSGKYTITSDSSAVKGDNLVQIGSELAGVGGVLSITAWTVVNNAAGSAAVGPAIEAVNVDVRGVGNSGSGKNIVISSKGRTVLSVAGALQVREAQIDHTAPSGTVGATVFSVADATILLKNVVVTNGTTAAVAGRIVEAGGNVDIQGGRFVSANDPKGVAVSSEAGVTIEGATISASGSASGNGYVVAAEKDVLIRSSATDSAAVIWSGSSASGTTVGGVYTKGNVTVYTDNLFSARVQVKGAGVGIDVWPDVVNHVSGTVRLQGSSANSVYVSVESGQALVVNNNDRVVKPGEVWDVELFNAVIRRSGGSARAALVDVIGAHVRIGGTSLTRSELTAGSNIAVVVNEHSLIPGLGGDLLIEGGNIVGVSGGVSAVTVNIGRGVIGTEGDRNVKIETQTGVTVRALKEIEVNNGNAVILNTAGIVNTNTAPSACVYSLGEGITIINVDSIQARGLAIALLTTAPRDTNGVNHGTVNVVSGKIKALGAHAISAADNVLVDQVDITKGATDSVAVWRPAKTKGGLATKLNVSIGAKRGNVEVSTAVGSASASAIYTDGGKVDIGKGEISATATGTAGTSAVFTLRGAVTVRHADANIFSNSGSAINVRNENVTVNGGTVASNPSSGSFAAIWVVDGQVTVGTAVAPGTTEEPKEWTRITSNGSLGIYLDGAGEYKAVVGKYGIINVKGSAATAGGIRVLKSVGVEFAGKFTASGTRSMAFAIEAAKGNVNIEGATTNDPGIVNKYYAEIKSDSGVAVTTVGGNITVKSYSTITGNAGKLLYAKDTTNQKAGSVYVGADSLGNAYQYVTVYNKFGTAVKAVEKVYVRGITGDNSATLGQYDDGGVVGRRVVIRTDTDTAITTGKVTTAETISGEVYLYGGRVWAAGNYGTSTPIAIASKKIYQYGGVIEVNTEKAAVDNEEVYTTAKATGILIRDKGGKGELKITGGKIIAHGASVGIKNFDLDVPVEITTAAGSTGRRWSIGNGSMSNKGLAAVSIDAGNNGTAIWSKGEITVKGNDTLTSADKVGGLLSVNVFIGSGNKASARAIHMPVDTGLYRKNLVLERAFVEAGSDGATAIEGGLNTKTHIDHSVVLVRHRSTAVNGKGGVVVYSGYVEVLATENINEGTAITGKEIRIDGGRGANEKSEVHSKGIALFDARSLTVDTAKVEITSEVKLSGTILSNLTVGSSVLGDTAHLTLGSQGSGKLYRLSTISDLTNIVEEGKKLLIPSKVKVFVADNGSTLETETGTDGADTLKIVGLVSTVGKQAGAKFINGGKVIVDSTGNVTFNKADNQSFYNNGLLVLRAGSKLDDSLLVHDTGVYITQNDYTFLKWAQVLTGNATAGIFKHTDQIDRGSSDSRVIVPPVFAVLYGDQSRFVSEDDRFDGNGNPFWDANSARVDTVYGEPVYVIHPIDYRYKDYVDTANVLHTLGFVSGTGIVRVDDEGTAYLTEAGTFTREAIAENEAGRGTKHYTHTVLPVDVKKLADRQLNEPIFFDGYLYNKDGRVIDRSEDTVFVRNSDDVVAVKYTSKPAKLLDGVRGWESDQIDIVTQKPVIYSGLGGEQFWYKGIGGTYFPLTTNIPTKRGTYEVWTSFQTGRNFEPVPGTENGVVYLGQVEIAPGDWTSVLNKKDSLVYDVFVELQADSAQTNRVATIPYLSGYGARYDTTDISLSGVEAAITGYRVTSNDNTESAQLTFAVTRGTLPGDFVELEIPVVNNSDETVNQNLRDGLTVRVHVAFLTAAEMKEPKPSYIIVDYRTEKLSGLIVGTTYSIGGVTLVATTTDTAIQTGWRDDANGKTISIVALSTVGSYKNASDTATLTIGKKIVTDSVLDGVHADSASNTTAWDGRLRNTTVAMEYRLLPETTWRPASAEATENLRAGTYEIRYAPTLNSFASAAVTRTISAKVVSVAEGSREIPKANVTAEGAVAPVKVAASLFKAGPSPVSKSQGEISFFSSKTVKTGTLYIFDANGKTVAKAKAAGTGKIASAKVGKFAEGTYVVKGVLVGKDGTKDKVSAVFSVVK